VDGQADLLEVVRTLRAGRGCAHFLHRRHQEGNQDCDDRNHHKQLNQGKCAT
jgi:hypothetical protein